MGTFTKWVRKVCLRHALRYRKAAVVAQKGFEDAIERIMALEEENRTLRQPDLEQLLLKKAVMEAETVHFDEMVRIRNKLLELPVRDVDYIKKAVRFTIVHQEDGWAIVERYCRPGGCKILGVERFPTERRALLYAYIRTCFGEEQISDGACADCEDSYIRERI